MSTTFNGKSLASSGTGTGASHDLVIENDTIVGHGPFLTDIDQMQTTIAQLKRF